MLILNQIGFGWHNQLFVSRGFGDEMDLVPECILSPK